MVERLESQQKTSSGLFIPETAQKIAILCKVIAVGPGRWIEGEFCKTAVKPGDTVLVPGAGNQYPDWQQGQQILIQSEDIGAIVG